jgi:hypothetical protein
MKPAATLKLTRPASAFFSGLCSFLSAFDDPPRRKTQDSDLENLRGDWQRVGDTMRAVIDRPVHEQTRHHSAA